jgi:hypothetical protein
MLKRKADKQCRVRAAAENDEAPLKVICGSEIEEAAIVVPRRSDPCTNNVQWQRVPESYPYETPYDATAKEQTIPEGAGQQTAAGRFHIRPLSGTAVANRSYRKSKPAGVP